MNKKGITMLSLVIYVILLFGITVFVTITSNTINERMFNERGLAINVTSSDKLEYNMLSSSNDSTYLDVFDNKIAFSNGDTYRYDSNKKVIYKNESVLVDNVYGFTITHTDKSRGGIAVNVNVTLKKYLNEFGRDIKVYAEE